MAIALGQSATITTLGGRTIEVLNVDLDTAGREICTAALISLGPAIPPFLRRTHDTYQDLKVAVLPWQPQQPTRRQKRRERRRK